MWSYAHYSCYEEMSLNEINNLLQMFEKADLIFDKKLGL